MFYTIIFLIIAFIIYGIYITVKFTQATKILGLRVAKNYDGYEEKGEAQLRRECYKHSISTRNNGMLNLCYLIPVLSMKGWHIELVKDGHEEYNNKEGNYLGSEEWIEKWRKIIFSPNITSSEFCQCIRLIMHAHNFDESENDIQPKVKGINGLIKEKDSFTMYRALYIMHYNVRIRKNKEELTKYMISNSLTLKERAKKGTFFTYPEEEIYNVKKLSEIVDIHKGYSIDESQITLEKNHKGLIFSIDIINGKCSMFYNNYTCISFEQYANFGYIIMNQLPPYSINKWKEDNCVLTNNILGFELSNEDVICDYLLLYLKLFIEEVRAQKTKKTKLELCELENCIVPIPSRSIQKDIIKKSQPNAHDNEKVKTLLDGFNVLFMETISDNISQMEKLANKESQIDNNLSSENSSVIDNSSHHYYGSKWVSGYYRKNGTYVQGHYKY